MSKSEITIVALLVALLLAWGYSQRTLFSGPPPKLAIGLPAGAAAVTQAVENVEPQALPPDTSLVAARAETTNAPAEAAAPAHVLPEQTVVLSNRSVAVTFSSWGGAVTSVEMKEYRAMLDRGSDPVKLDFSDSPALAWTGMPGLSGREDVEMSMNEAASAVTIRRTIGGLRYERIVSLGDGYLLSVSDAVANVSSAPLALPGHGIACGPMPVQASRKKSQDYAFLGMDSLAAHGGERVKYWMTGGFMKKSPVLALFSSKSPGSGEPPPHVTHCDENPVSWVATKNKFFVQILAPEDGSTSGCELDAWRDTKAGKGVVLSAVAAAALFPPQVVQPGNTFARTMQYYVGPKKYTLLKALGNHQDEVMDFGTWFGWVCKILLPTLNGLHAVFNNYGVAIILLTLLVRILFWPLTHKSTEDMKKMQAIQPLVAQLREKYKDKPQKLNQETMALYKEHKVNPMSGCLPMVVQIPVFFALFTVLRSAIELRFAPFLWVRDLSEPEGLFAGTKLFQMLPMVDSLNILPLLMTATTLWQQKLTPTAGDPQQQKIMNLMPIFMLFLFYNMASALVLYWTVSQLLAIAQLVWQRRRTAARAAQQPAPARR